MTNETGTHRRFPLNSDDSSEGDVKPEGTGDNESNGESENESDGGVDLFPLGGSGSEDEGPRKLCLSSLMGYASLTSIGTTTLTSRNPDPLIDSSGAESVSESDEPIQGSKGKGKG